jgi:hypothetical protein
MARTLSKHLSLFYYVSDVYDNGQHIGIHLRTLGCEAVLPIRFLFGLASGAAAVFLLTRKFPHDVRPAAKSALVSAMKALHGARVGSAELIEALEDLYAEAKDEATREIIAEAMAAAKARAAGGDKQAGEPMAPAGAEMPASGNPSESTGSGQAGKTRKQARKSSTPRKKSTGNA